MFVVIGIINFVHVTLMCASLPLLSFVCGCVLNGEGYFIGKYKVGINYSRFDYLVGCKKSQQK